METFIVFKLITKNWGEISISRTVHNEVKMYYNSKKTNVKNELLIKNSDIDSTFVAIEISMLDTLNYSNEFDNDLKHTHLLEMCEIIVGQLPFLDNIEFVEFEFGLKSKTPYQILETMHRFKKNFKEKTFKIGFNIDSKLADKEFYEINEFSIVINLEC
jgi:hypothetical protein